jgi:hypothetical protein
LQAVLTFWAWTIQNEHNCNWNCDQHSAALSPSLWSRPQWRERSTCLCWTLQCTFIVWLSHSVIFPIIEKDCYTIVPAHLNSILYIFLGSVKGALAIQTCWLDFRFHALQEAGLTVSYLVTLASSVEQPGWSLALTINWEPFVTALASANRAGMSRIFFKYFFWTAFKHTLETIIIMLVGYYDIIQGVL